MAFTEVAAKIAKEVVKEVGKAAAKTGKEIAKGTAKVVGDVAVKSLESGQRESGWAGGTIVESGMREIGKNLTDGLVSSPEIGADFPAGSEVPLELELSDKPEFPAELELQIETEIPSEIELSPMPKFPLKIDIPVEYLPEGMEALTGEKSDVPEIGDYREIKPEGTGDFQTSRSFWDKLIGAETSSFPKENQGDQLKTVEERHEPRFQEPIDAKKFSGYEEHTPEILQTAEKDASENNEKDAKSNGYSDGQETRQTEKSGVENRESENAQENLDGKHCPIEGHGGHWDGERGNSKWIPDKDHVPQKQNPEQQNWGKILNEYGIDNVPFKDGDPNFDEVSKGKVEIEDFSADRSDNFDKADIELANQRGCTPEEVAKWRKENGYTWHECRDMKTMQKVPSKVHNNIPHSGGVSEAKKESGEPL